MKDANGRKSVSVSGTLTDADLTSPILCKVNVVDTECEQIYAGTDGGSDQALSFTQRVDLFAEHYASDTKIPSPVSTNCSGCAFIRSITQAVKDSVEQWTGEHNMVDMWEIVKRYYYDPATNGPNSIKQVLSAILNSSAFLQDKGSGLKSRTGKSPTHIKCFRISRTKIWAS